MNKVPLGRRIRAWLGIGIKAIARLFNWWLIFRLGERTIFVMPDGLAILGAWFIPSFFAPQIYIYNLWMTAATLLASPFALLSILSIRHGKVCKVNLFLLLPYWWTRVPAAAQFDLFEAWEDPAPTGVVFSYSGKELHFGTANNAIALEKSIGGVLLSQGWTAPPYSRGTLLSPCIHADGVSIRQADTQHAES